MTTALTTAWLMSGLAYAQSGVVRGQVVDGGGAPIAGAVVSVGAGAAVVTTTDADGAFALPARADGTAIDVEIVKPHFTTVRTTLTPDATPVRIRLDVAGLAEQVTVVSPLFDTASFDRYGASRTIVTAAQVRDLNAVDLASALRRTPGVTVSRFNPVGSFGGAEGGAVFVRGMGATRPGSEIRTFIDGAPFYMGIWGHPLLDLLPVNAMDRIDVIKGPQPQTFGNTFSAIDLSARRATGQGVAGHVRIAGGAFSTLVEQVDVSARLGAWDIALAQGFARSAGHRDEADGRLANGLARVGYRWSDAWRLDALAMRVDNTASDPGQMGRPETRTGTYATNGTLLSTTLTHAVGVARGTVQVYANRGEGNWFDQPAPDGDTLTRFGLVGLRWREGVPLWQGSTLEAGLDVDRIDGEVAFNRVAPAPTTRFDADALRVVAPHAALAHTLDVGAGWTLTPSVGARAYDHSVFGAEVAPHAGLVARHVRGISVRATYARGVTYPGQEVVVLSSLIPALGATWRTLQAETMDHVELGATFAPSARTTVDVAWFDDRVRNRFVFGFPPVVRTPSFVNLGSYSVRGAEVAVRQQIARSWTLSGGLTLLDPSLATVPYAPKAALVLGATGTVGRLRVSVDTQSQNEMSVLARSRTAAGGAVERVGGFTVVNVRPSWALEGPRRLEVFVAIENLLDADYAYRPGYPMPGIAAQAGVSLGF